MANLNCTWNEWYKYKTFPNTQSPLSHYPLIDIGNLAADLSRLLISCTGLPASFQMRWLPQLWSSIHTYLFLTKAYIFQGKQHFHNSSRVNIVVILPLWRLWVMLQWILYVVEICMSATTMEIQNKFHRPWQ